MFAEAIRLPMNFDQELPTHQAPHANIQCFHGGDEAEKILRLEGKNWKHQKEFYKWFIRDDFAND